MRRSLLSRSYRVAGRIEVKRKIAFQREAHKRRDAAKAVHEKAANSGRIPRGAKLVALASRMYSMLESGQVEML
jgi:hypothetical protein